MTCFSRELHPIYGAVPRDGEHVKVGDILGLSPDGNEVITSPVDGWVRLVLTSNSHERHLTVEVWDDRNDRDGAGATEAVA